MVKWVLGIDVGTKKTGTAIGQSVTGNAKPLTRIFVPVQQLQTHHFDKIIQTWKVNCIVIGLPVMADGKPHPLQTHILRLAKDFENKHGLEVHFADETLTSHEAMLRFPKAADCDSAAAAIMIEDYFSLSGE